MPHESAKPKRNKTNISGVFRWGGVALALLGWWISLDLARLHYGLEPANPLIAKACSAVEGVSPCRGAVASRWGSVALSSTPGAPRLPVAVFGMGYFAFVGLWLLLIGAPTVDRRAWHILPVAVVAVGMINSAQYTLIMLNELDAVCLGCLAVHVVNALLAAAVLLLFPWRSTGGSAWPHPRGSTSLATFMAGSFLFLIHLLIAMALFQNQLLGRLDAAYRTIVDDPAYATWSFERQPRVDIRLGDRPMLGRPDAPHTIVMFGDFQCPRCREAHAALLSVLDRHSDRVRLALVHCPLDQACYPELPRTLHPLACRAATTTEAVRMTAGEEAYWALFDELFTRQPELSAGVIDECVRKVGVDPARVNLPEARAAADEAVQRDVELARGLRIAETPRVFLDGRQVEQWKQQGLWDALLTPEAEASEAIDAP